MPQNLRLARAFTLVELLIVIAIIAVLAAVALPNLLSSRLSANESAAISALRTVTSAQAQARNRTAVDVDGDGQGEYLYFGELSGVAPLRGVGTPLDPAAVSVSFGLVANSAVNKSGYHFAVYLPGAGGVGVAEDPGGGKAAALAVDANLCETFWAAYAWPANFGQSGRRAFVVNQSGDVLQTNNAAAAQGYSGVGAAAVVPAFDAAYSGANDMALPLSVGGNPAPAADGGTWLPVN